jgi:hypothetical protein
MKKLHTLLYMMATTLTAISLLTACQMEDDLSGKKKEAKGYLDASLVAQTTEPLLTRATSEQYDVDTFPVAIVSTESGDTIQKFNTYSDLKAEGQIELTAGAYRVAAWYGTDDADVQSTPYFIGQADFTVVAKNTSKVTAVCKLGRVRVSINVGQDFEAAFEDDYTITVNNSHGMDVITAETKDKSLYFKPYEGDKSISVTVKATPVGTTTSIVKSFELKKQGENAEDGSDLDLEAGDAFKINLSASDTSDGTVTNPTDASFGISVDLKWNERNEAVEVPVDVITVTPSNGNDNADNNAGDNNTGDNTGNNGEGDTEVDANALTLTPSINGQQVWTLHLAYEDEAELKVDINAPATIQSLQVNITTSDEDFASEITRMGIDEFDLCNITKASQKTILVNTLGLKCNDDVKGQTFYSFDVSAFTVPLSGYPGEHHFAITVTDGDGQQASGTLIVTCDGAPDEDEE